MGLVSRGFAVLLVEDHVLLRRQTAAVLDELCGEVHHAGSAAEARRLLGQVDVKLLVTDIDLDDGRTGLDLAWTVASTRPHVMVVVSSARRCIAAELPPSAIFLPKPYRPQDLRDLLVPLQGVRDPVDASERAESSCSSASGAGEGEFGRYCYPVELAADGYGAIFAMFPDLPEANTHGRTEEEALANARRSLAGTLEHYLLEGRVLPSPSTGVGTAKVRVSGWEVRGAGGAWTYRHSRR